jgi:two-component system uhpT operon response regulator UhpA
MEQTSIPLPHTIIVTAEELEQIDELIQLLPKLTTRLEHNTPIALLAPAVPKNYIARLAELGVKAVLNYSITPQQLAAILELLPNYQIFDESIVSRSAASLATPTKREHEIAFLLSKGLSVKQIAKQLRLSEKTVETHKYNLMRKLRVHNRVQLVRWFITNYSNTELLDEKS